MPKKQMIIIGTILLAFMTGCQFNESKNGNPEEIETTSGQDEQTVSLPDQPLQKGDESEAVGDLQHHLIEIGYPIEQTNTYDELTTWAITDLQLQSEDVYVTGVYDDEMRSILEAVIDSQLTITVGDKLQKPEQPNEFTEVIENPYEILALVNKSYALPNDYEPEDLVIPDVRFPFSEDDPKKQLRKVAADALEEMFNASDEAGLELFAQSGYRSFNRQEAIFAANVDRHGEEKANTYSARPGESEHQTGLVMDVTSRTIGFQLEIDFENTAE